MSAKPYSLSTAAVAGSAASGSALALLDFVRCHPAKIRGSSEEGGAAAKHTPDRKMADTAKSTGNRRIMKSGSSKFLLIRVQMAGGSFQKARGGYRNLPDVLP